jgi:hypothetical protein
VNLLLARLTIASVPAIEPEPDELHVLLRHRPPSIPAGRSWGQETRRTTARTAEQKELTAEPNQGRQFRGVTAVRPVIEHITTRRDAHLRRRPIARGTPHSVTVMPPEDVRGVRSRSQAGLGEPFAEPRPDASDPGARPRGDLELPTRDGAMIKRLLGVAHFAILACVRSAPPGGLPASAEPNSTLPG